MVADSAKMLRTTRNVLGFAYLRLESAHEHFEASRHRIERLEDLRKDTVKEENPLPRKGRVEVNLAQSAKLLGRSRALVAQSQALIEDISYREKHR